MANEPLTWDEIVTELEGDDSLSPRALDHLRSEITEWDCEGWPTAVGHALLDRIARSGS